MFYLSELMMSNPLVYGVKQVEKKVHIQDSLNYHVFTESLVQEILHRLL